MVFSEHDGLRCFSFGIFSSAVTQAVFTRRGGVSPVPWSSLNLGGTVGDEPGRVEENRRRAFAAIDRSPSSLFDAWLVHSAKTVCADRPRPTGVVPPKADAVLTDNPEVTLFLRFADCVPILLHDGRRKVVGIVHAGWLGTVRGAVLAAIATMKSRYSCDPADISAGIGPSIGPDHYEVKEDVGSEVAVAFGKAADQVIRHRDGRLYMDLWAANRMQLESGGVHSIEMSNLCTACLLDDWYSHRAESGQTGRFGAMIALNS
jgi:hypothetical protein